MSIGLAVTSTIFSFMSFIFFMIGAIGYAVNKGVVKNVPWLYYESGDQFVWVGTREIIFRQGNESQLIKYNNDMGQNGCLDTYCADCRRTGKRAVALMVIACFMSLLTAVLSGLTIANGNIAVRGSSIFTAITAAMTGIVGFGLFMTFCYDALDFAIDVPLEYASGSVLPLFAFFAMMIVTVFNIIDAYISGETKAEV
jgi:hypothetical protein